MDFVTQETVEAFLHSSVYPLLKETHTVGAIASVVKFGRLNYAFCHGYGYERVEDGEVVNTSSTWFDMGRCAKVVTAVAVMFLAQEHGISLDTDVNQILPASVKIDTKGQGVVTLHHLLSHTSGLMRGAVSEPSSPSGHHSRRGSAPHHAAGPPPVLSPSSGRRRSSLRISAIIMDQQQHQQQQQQYDQDGFPLTEPPTPSRSRQSLDAGSGGAAAVLSPSGVQSQTPPPYHAQHHQHHASLDCVDAGADVMGYLQLFEIKCVAPPGMVYRPSDVDYMLLGAVVEQLSQQRFGTYVQDRILGKLGVTLGCGVRVCCYQATGPGTRVAGRISPDLTPVSGLVLTAEGAVKLLQALLQPKAQAQQMRVKGAAAAATASSTLPGEEALQLDPEMVSRLFQIHFVDSYKETSAGYALSSSGLGRTGPGCMVIESLRPLGGEEGGGGSSGSSSQGPGCQALLCITPEAGLGVLLAANTVHHSSSKQAFCSKLASKFLEQFRPLELPAALARAWLLNMQPVKQDAVVHVVCFPYAGGSASLIYEQWASLLPEFVRVRVIQFPGRGLRSRDPPLVRVSKLAAVAAQVLGEVVNPAVPLALFGHGLGALVAFEAARKLEGWYQRKLLHLFVSGCASPGCWPSNQDPHVSYTPWRPELLPANIAAAAASKAQAVAAGHGAHPGAGGSSSGSSKAHELPDDQLLQLLSAYPRTPKSLRKDHVALQESLHTLRADIECEETYTYTSPEPAMPDAVADVMGGIQGRASLEARLSACQLACPVTALWGEEDGTLSRQEMEGWSQVSSGLVRLHPLPGDHFYLEDKRGAASLLNSMAQVLGRQLTVHTPWLGRSRKAAPPQPAKPTNPTIFRV